MEFRLVLHKPGPASADGAHGDLFIKSGEVLITYNWPLADLPAAGNARFSRLTAADSGILLKRKQDHRLHYWTHEGEVSNDRGTVAELLRGEIEIPSDFPSEIRVVPAP